MSQHQWIAHPNVEVRFEFMNRSKVNLAEFIDPYELHNQIYHVRSLRFTDNEIAYLASLKGKNGDKLFSLRYLANLATIELPIVVISYYGDKITILTEGPWWTVTLWETIIMSIVSELYYREVVARSGQTLAAVYENGMRRLDQKIIQLQDWPSIRFSDFGTRRRFSRQWQEMVYACLENAFGTQERFLGTSNVLLAGRTPIGTWAHEEPMVLAALADSDDRELRKSQSEFLGEWQAMYQPNLLIALSDTFGSGAFFEDFKPFAHTWAGVRHDSGDPFEFGEKVIAYYESLGIDPMTKTIVFSDGLTVSTITKLFYKFQNRIWMVFGWGTNLTNDMGFEPISIVMKAVAARRAGEIVWHPAVKLSDNILKATGASVHVERYRRVFGATNTASTKLIY